MKQTRLDSFIDDCFLIKLLFTEKKQGFRQDIQGLRGLAISAVLLYHFIPNVVSYGFLGVDMFFVISGYLISMILTSTPRLDSAALLNFYMRRIKRIVPLYYIVFGSAAFISIFVLSYSWLIDNFQRFHYSLLFLLNFDLYHAQKGYFGITANNHEVFLNGWSLSVEMQFYLVAPFFFLLHNLFMRKFGQHGRFLSIGILVIVVIGSQLYPYFTVIDNRSFVAFYHPLSRCWQFASGIIAHLAQTQKQNTKEEVSPVHRYLLCISLLISGTISMIVMIPFMETQQPLYSILSSYFRIFVTISTAVMLFCGEYVTLRPLTGKYLRYIGDLSYSLYLVHWPILELCKYYAKWSNVPVVIAFCVALILSICIAMLLHHLVEKPLLKQSAKIGCLIAFILFLMFFSLHGHWSKPHERLMGPNAHAIHANAGFLKGVFVHEEAMYARPKHEVTASGNPFGYAEFPPGNGSLRVMVVGNSYATQQVAIIKRIMADKYSRFVFYTYPGNQVLVTYKQKVTDAVRELIARFKPNLLFVINRYLEKELQPYMDMDPTMIEFLQNAEFLQMYADHIFIESPHPLYPVSFLNNYMDRLEWNQSIEKANMNLTEAMSEIQYAWLRVNVLLTKCAKCVLLHSDTPFIDKERDIVRMYDPVTLLSYVDNTIHLTEEGLRMVESSYRPTVQSIINQYVNSSNSTNYTNGSSSADLMYQSIPTPEGF